jgi:formylglycine-generating enzyme required for sulfatase activity
VYVKEQINWFMTIRPYMVAQFRPYVLSATVELALKPKDSFRECAKDCPEMIVIPAGSFVMGSPTSQKGHDSLEEPQHKVTIAKPFAVAKFELTFVEWNACAAHGDCGQLNDSGFGRGHQPAINVSWDDAQRYVGWLSRMTGKPYRLLSEAEYEYAMRAGTQTAYPWGDEIGQGNANCNGCGSQWDGQHPAPVGSFAPNQFGLYDMAGNVWESVEDCFHDNYKGAPEDGSAWIEGDDCVRGHVIRGGSWLDFPEFLRSAARDGRPTDARLSNYGFRVGRTLTP